jgi:hypothetical protein
MDTWILEEINMEQIIKINPDSNLGSICFYKSEVAIVEDFKQNEETQRTNIYLKNGMAITIEDVPTPDTFADCIFGSPNPIINFNVKTARVKRAERTLSFQL